TRRVPGRDRLDLGRRVPGRALHGLGDGPGQPGRVGPAVDPPVQLQADQLPAGPDGGGDEAVRRLRGPRDRGQLLLQRPQPAAQLLELLGELLRVGAQPAQVTIRHPVSSPYRTPNSPWSMAEATTRNPATARCRSR